MVKLVDKQNVFNKGIMTSKLWARDDLQQYTQGVADAENFVLSKYGPLTKRVGTKFIADLGNPGEEAALIPFTFSVDKSILLEVTSDKIRFYTFDGEDFGQTRIYKLTTEDADAEYTALYYTDESIKSWGEYKEKATLLYSDKSCTKLVGYVASSLDNYSNWDTIIPFDTGYDLINDTTKHCTGIAINKKEKLFSFVYGGIWSLSKDSVFIFPEEPKAVCLDSHNKTLVCLGANNTVYYLDLSSFNPTIDTTANFKSVKLPTKTTTKSAQSIIGLARTVDSNTLGTPVTNSYLVIPVVFPVSHFFISSNGGKTWTTKSFDALDVSGDFKVVFDRPRLDWLFFITEKGYLTRLDISTLGGSTALSGISLSNKGIFPIRNAYYVIGIGQKDYIDKSSMASVDLLIYDLINSNILLIQSYTGSHLTNSDIAEGKVLRSNIGYKSSMSVYYNRFYAIIPDSKYKGVLYDTTHIDTTGLELVDSEHDWLCMSYGDFEPFIASASDGYRASISFAGTEVSINIKQPVNRGLMIVEDSKKPTSTLGSVSKHSYNKSDDIVFYEFAFDKPLSKENIRDISYAQSLDVLYLAFPDGKTPPKELRRKSDTHWEMVDFKTEDGPYGETNYDQTKKLSLSTHTIADDVVITSSVDLFKESDVGRHIRINMAAYNSNTLAYEDHWTWGIINSYTDAKHVKASMKIDNSKVKDNTTTIGPSTTSWEWRLGAWNSETGYPTKVTIHEQRLAWSGITDRPWVWLSNSFAYTFYAPSEYDGTITDSNAISHDLSTDKISQVRWMKSVKNLIIGTEFEELRMLSAGPSLSPSDVAVVREASYGSFNAEPVITEDVIIFIQRLQRSLRALSYDYYRDAFLGPNLVLLAEDLTLGGIRRVVFQKEPYSVLWVLKEDGTLLACTYDKEQEVTGWTKCKLAEGARVIDLMVFPSSNIKQDSVAFIVEREINNTTKRYMELLTREYLSDVDIKDVTFLDCCIRYKGEKTNKISGLEHLIGQTVMVTEEGGIIGKYLVKSDQEGNGYIELDTEVHNAWIGLPYEAYFKTLERDFGDKQISTQNSKLRIFKLYFTLINTLGLKVHQLNDGEEFNMIIFDPESETGNTKPITGREELRIISTWTNDIMKYCMQVDSIEGLPCTVSGITIGVEINAL